MPFHPATAFPYDSKPSWRQLLSLLAPPTARSRNDKQGAEAGGKLPLLPALTTTLSPPRPTWHQQQSPTQAGSSGAEFKCSLANAEWPLKILFFLAFKRKPQGKWRSLPASPLGGAHIPHPSMTGSCFTVFATCAHPSNPSIGQRRSFINDLVSGLVQGAEACRE